MLLAAVKLCSLLNSVIWRQADWRKLGARGVKGGTVTVVKYEGERGRVLFLPKAETGGVVGRFV